MKKLSLRKGNTDPDMAGEQPLIQVYITIRTAACDQKQLAVASAVCGWALVETVPAAYVLPLVEARQWPLLANSRTCMLFGKAVSLEDCHQHALIMRLGMVCSTPTSVSCIA